MTAGFPSAFNLKVKRERGLMINICLMSDCHTMWMGHLVISLSICHFLMKNVDDMTIKPFHNWYYNQMLSNWVTLTFFLCYPFNFIDTLWGYSFWIVLFKCTELGYLDLYFISATRIKLHFSSKCKIWPWNCMMLFIWLLLSRIVVYVSPWPTFYASLHLVFYA